MTPDDQRRAAQAVIESPFVLTLLDDMERAATRQCLFAEINDDDTRRSAAAEARAIIRFRERLEALARHIPSRHPPA